MSDRLKAVEANWGTVPEWIKVLAAACDASSQNKVAKQLGRSASVVSQVLNNAYAGNMRDIEKRVWDVLQASEIDCPALGIITSKDCLQWADYARSLSSHSPIRVRMFTACRNCPRFTHKEVTK